MRSKAPVERQSLNQVFGILGILILAALLWAAHDDVESRRPWKGFQRRFFAVQREILEKKTRAAEEGLRAPGKQDRVKGIESRLAEIAREVEDWEEANEDKVAAIRNLEDRIHDVEMSINFRKSELDEAFYWYQHAAIQGGDMAPYEAEMKRLEERISKLEGEMADLGAKKAAAAGPRDEKLAEARKLRVEMNATERELVLARQNLNDLARPRLEIKQIVVDRLGAVDRCQTCHLGIDDPSFASDEIPRPFRTHPHREELLGENHPIEGFGCTVCHDGQGSQTKGVGWGEFDHGWDDPHWEKPLLKGAFVQSSCLACHEGYADQEHAPILSRGKALFVEVGCYGCHRMEGIDPFRKQAPKLNGIATKTSRDWIAAWLGNPKAFRPKTRMPSFWPEAIDETGRDRVGSPEHLRREEEIAALTEFLVSLSEAGGAPEAPIDALADPKRIEIGERIVDVVGCRACHTLGEGDKPRADGSAVAFGPDLSRVGEKLNGPWLVEWLLDPKPYWSRTLMPSFRLEREEAVSAAAFLMTLTGPSAAAGGAPAAAARAVMDETARQALVDQGKKLVGFYGCFGCHETAGFEKAMPIGVELTEFGEKPTARLDFGQVKLGHRREKNWYAWTRMKLGNPRVFKTRRIDLKMPNFGLADDEIEAIMVFLKGMARPKNPEQYRIQAPEKTSEGRGEDLTRRYNCRGCHEIAGKGGDIAAHLADPGMRPPVLTGEGKKVQGEWLFRFLRGPTTLRPWLETRMPTFGLEEEQANDLVNYFVSLSSQKLPYPARPWREIEGEPARIGKDMFARLKCLQCHVVSLGDGKQLSDLAPDLSMAAGRLRPEWVLEWLLDPQLLQPGTKMPDFFPRVDEEDPTLRSTPLPGVLDGDVFRQAEIIRDYIGNLSSHRAAAGPIPGARGGGASPP